MVINRSKRIMSLILTLFLTMTMVNMPSRAFAATEYTTDHELIELQAERSDSTIRTTLMTKKDGLNLGGLGLFYSFDDKVELDPFSTGRNVNTSVIDGGRSWNEKIYKAGLPGTDHDVPAGTWLVYFTHTLKSEFQYDTEYEFAVRMDMAYEGKDLEDYDWCKDIFKVTYAEYTVKFEAPDADTPVEEMQYVVRGQQVTVPDDPQRTGYEFDVWEAAEGSSASISDAIMEPVTFHATWKEAPAADADVTIDPDGGTITPNDDVDKDGKIADGKKVGDTIKVPDIEKPGYTLKNWEDENGNPLQPGDEYMVPTGKGTLKPVWEANPADVTINPDGGTIIPNDDVDKDGKIADGKKVGDTIKVPEIEKPGYTLKNWEDENGNPLQPGDEYTIPADKGSLKPVWEANPADLTVDPDGGTITPNDDVDKDGKIADGKKVGDTIKVPDIEKPGYTLKNWEDENGNPLQPGDEYTIPADKGSLKPVWEANPADVTVDPDGGTITPNDDVDKDGKIADGKKVGDTIQVPEIEKPGYTLKNWEDENGNPLQPGHEYTIPADKGSLKPVWEANPADVTIDPDGGTITPNDDVDKDGKIADGKKVGDTIKVPEIEKPGYTLKNWEDENGNPLQPGDEYTIPADKGSLKPVWEANPADVTIDPDGGTITPNDDVDKDGKIADGKKVGDTIKVPEIEKPGYTLKNWEDENGNPLQPGDEYTIPADKGTLKPVWEANPADVTVDPTGGTITPNDDVDKDGKIADGKKVGDTIKVPEIEKPGYTLKNWEDENGNPLQPGDEYTIPADKGSLKPVWEANPADTVTINPSENGTVTADTTTPKAGDEVTLTISPDEGYTLDDLKVTDGNGNPIDLRANDDGTYSFTMPEPASAVVDATFKEEAKPSERRNLNTTDHIRYVQGYDDGTVRPAGNITRAETATMIYRLLTDAHRDEIFTTENPFTDVTADLWFNKAVSSMANGDYLKGYEDGTFLGNRNITRAEFATILTRFTNVEKKELNFSDLDNTIEKRHWAYDSIATGVSQGWINGYDDGTFRPNRDITRAEAMAMLNRFLGRGVNKESTLGDYVSFPDNSSSEWYYYEVIEATNDHEYEGTSPSENWTSNTVDHEYDIDKYERP